MNIFLWILSNRSYYDDVAHVEGVDDDDDGDCNDKNSHHQSSIGDVNNFHDTHEWIKSVVRGVYFLGCNGIIRVLRILSHMRRISHVIIEGTDGGDSGLYMHATSLTSSSLKALLKAAAKALTTLS